MMIETNTLAIIALICIIATVCASIFVVIFIILKAYKLSFKERLFFITFISIILSVDIIMIRWYIQILSEFLIE